MHLSAVCSGLLQHGYTNKFGNKDYKSEKLGHSVISKKLNIQNSQFISIKLHYIMQLVPLIIFETENIIWIILFCQAIHSLEIIFL